MHCSTPWLIPALAVLAAALVGCANEPVTLAIRAQPPTVAEKFPRPIAFLHDKELKEVTETVQGDVPLRIGEASDRALRGAYGQCFGQMREVSSVEEYRAISGADAPFVLLKPEIVGFQMATPSGRAIGPFHAEIIYRFTILDTAGASVGRWEMHGLGNYDPDQARREHSPEFHYDLNAWVAEAPRRAIENAAANFVAGFSAVPELMRLKRNLPLALANIPSGQQQDVDGGVPGAKQARYAGALAVTAAKVALPKAPLDTQQASDADLIPLRITVRNDGSHRLLLDPANVRWQLVQAAVQEVPEVSPLPVAVVPMFLARSPTPFMAFGPMSPGVGMLPGLFAALANETQFQQHQKAMAAWTTAVQRDLLTEGVVAPGAERTGLVYFPKLKLTYATLLVPVVDLEDAVRYTVHLNLQAERP